MWRQATLFPYFSKFWYSTWQLNTVLNFVESHFKSKMSLFPIISYRWLYTCLCDPIPAFFFFFFHICRSLPWSAFFGFNHFVFIYDRHATARTRLLPLFSYSSYSHYFLTISQVPNYAIYRPLLFSRSLSSHKLDILSLIKPEINFIDLCHYTLHWKKCTSVMQNASIWINKRLFFCNHDEANVFLIN